MLAENLRTVSADEWPQWRIIDLEGARTGKPPASVRWKELVALCLALEVPLWELALPEKGKLAVVASQFAKDEFVEA